jgi:hypothetical protein
MGRKERLYLISEDQFNEVVLPVIEAMAYRGWGSALNQFAVIYEEDRVPL